MKEEQTLTQSEGSEVHHRSRVAAGVHDVILKLKHRAAAAAAAAERRHTAAAVFILQLT